MKVRNSIILETLRALVALDGLEKERFKFAPLTMLAIARNIRRLKDVSEDIERIRQELIREHGVGKSDEKGNRIPDPPEKIRAFNDAYQQVLDAEEEIVLSRIKVKELKLEANNIPVTVLAELDWLLLDEERPGAAHD
jgi:hypothetical protein